MPSEGQTQIPAGINKSPVKKPLGKRTMYSKDVNIESSLSIENVPYKGNAVLNANK